MMTLFSNEEFSIKLDRSTFTPDMDLYLAHIEEYLKELLKVRGWLTVADALFIFNSPLVRDIKYYQYGWDNESKIEFEVFPCGSSFVISLLNTKKIM